MILDKGPLLETEQMFRDAGEQWPVIIPEEEILQAAPGTKLRFYKLKGSGRCDDRSTAPPCILGGNDGTCVLKSSLVMCMVYAPVLGDRTKNVGVVDSEYIVHLGLPTLGVLDGTKEPSGLQRVNNRTEG
ncbi:unnamed protein product [Camellia sinensis]